MTFLFGAFNASLLAVLVFSMRRWLRRQQEIDSNVRLLSERQAEFAVLLKAERSVAQLSDQARVADLVRSLASAAAQIEDRIANVSADLNKELETQFSAFAATLRNETDRMGAQHPPPEVASADPVAYIDSLPEARVLEIASALSVLRPIVPYPGWSFDADWRNTELAFRMRRSVWTYFNQRHIAAPLDVAWHHGTRLLLYLGNDVSRQIFISGCIDPNEFALLDKLLVPGMVLMDVGANEGIYSVFAAARVGSRGMVWALEPSQREMERIGANLRLNSLSNVRTLQVALAEEDGERTLLVAGYAHEGHNTLGEFVYETSLERKESVVSRRLDTIVEENEIRRLDVLKIDVEGAELRALSGGRATLQRFRPLVLFEANERSLRTQGAGLEDLTEYFRSLEYRLYLIDTSTGLPSPSFEGRFGENMLAVPAERELPPSVFLTEPV